MVGQTNYVQEDADALAGLVKPRGSVVRRFCEVLGELLRGVGSPAPQRHLARQRLA